MQHLEMSPFVSIVRLYDQAGGYEERTPYKACVMVQWLTRTDAYLSGAVGEINRQAWQLLLAMLKEQGVKTVSLERRGKMKYLTL